MTTPTDYRALCAELTDALDAWQFGGGPPEDSADADLIARARAALAQPDPHPAHVAGAAYMEAYRMGRESALAQPEPVGVTDAELLSVDDLEIAWNAQADAVNSWDELGIDEIVWFAQQQALARWGCPAIKPVPEEVEELIQCLRTREHSLTQEGASLRDRGDGSYFGRAADMLTRFTRPAIEPVPVSERFEFSVFDSEYVEQAGGTAPTYSQALSEGQHYLAMYSQDGTHTLELRRVQVLPHHVLLVPQSEA